MEKMVATIATAAVLSSTFASTALASTYTVQQGDTLFNIAKKHGTTVSNLKQLNGLSSDNIYVNQTLKVADTGEQVQATAPAAPAPAPVTSSASAAASYTVVSGDTLSKIAYRSGISLTDLRAMNGISGDLIYAGQTLKVPAGGSTSAANPSAAPAVAASGSTYTVVSGDTLIKIANRYGISLAELQSWNGISGSLIYPGQVLKVSGGSVASTPVVTEPTNAVPTTNNASGSVYVIKSGDTLGKIALQTGLNVSQLKALNGLTSDLIFPGQTLKISGTASTSVTPVTNNTQGGTQTSVVEASTPTIAEVLNHAKKLIGVPYVFGGQTPAGFDCSGFIYYVFNQAGESISRLSAAGYYDRAFEVSSPQVGDLVFFKDTYIKGISHLGIYIGNGEFIHAGSDGVDISSVNNVYWKSHFDSYKRFY
ncbi:LysM peptidoglycan-binding domain-containing protein [Niallia oryzisoli]|uniref:LysM peptidoglycan-binding domain-containing protein n=1 Tax=Niallia oryzisoli TaxID=1737571 RepID=A0ABZ2CD01_9BACI